MNEKNGMVELFHGKPLFPRMISRQVLGNMPSGSFESHQVKGILIMDTGADYDPQTTSLTYMVNLLRRYRTADGFGDIPFHYFIDSQGKIFAGRPEMIPAQLHVEDPFTQRSKDKSQKDILVTRLSRMTKPVLNLRGYITIVLLGDYDQSMITKEQEKSLFQLVSYICFSHYFSREDIIGLRTLYPDTQNPGFYLNNYLSPSILEKNIPTPPRKPHYLRVPGKDG